LDGFRQRRRWLALIGLRRPSRRPAILKVVDANDPPLRIFFGSGGLNISRAEYARRIETWEEWNNVSMEAQGDWAAHKVASAGAGICLDVVIAVGAGGQQGACCHRS